MKNKYIHRLFYIGIFVIFIAILLFLFISAIHFGLYYQYDIDELFHVQLVYLIGRGYAPYRSFFMIHTPIFQWLLLPLFTVFGFSFSTIFKARIVMMLFFILRILFSFFIVKKIFNIRTAIYLIPITLLDPYTVFNGMQIRPDILAITLLIFGLFLLTRKNLKAVAGLVLGLSLLTNLKVLPSIGVFVILYGIKCLVKRDVRRMLLFMSSFLSVFVIFGLYFLLKGDLYSMIRHVLIDSRIINDSLAYSSKIWSFYQGIPGRLLAWEYMYVVLFLALIAGSNMIYSLISQMCHSDRSRCFWGEWRNLLNYQIVLLSCLVAQWMWLASIKNAFSQYLLTVGWLMNICAAYGLSVLVSYTARFIQKEVVYILLLVLFFVFAWESIYSHNAKSKISIWYTENQIQETLNKIPENAATYPNVLFRPLAYPLPYGAFFADIPQQITDRFPKVRDVLENQKVKYVLMSDYLLSLIDADSRRYILDHYQGGVDGILKRK